MVTVGQFCKKIDPISRSGPIISQKIDLAKIGKLISHSFQNIAQLFGMKPNLVTFDVGGGESACH